MFSDVLDEFKSSVNFQATRIERLPSIILVFGGKISVETGHEYSSCRNVFLNWTHTRKHNLSNYLRSPEDYKEWNNFEGYPNLIEFERDAGCLSSSILLFSESEGAIAELGSFVMDETLRERLLIVISEQHYQEISYISLGPIKLIQNLHPEDSIFVSKSIKPKEFEAELEALCAVLENKFSSLPKTQNFNHKNTRDQLLLVADLVELFGTLTRKELKDLIEHVGITLLPSRFNQIVNQLKLFELIQVPKTGVQNYLIAPEKSKRENYLNYVAVTGQPNFDRARFKLKAFLELKKDTLRFKAYEQIHGNK